VLIDGLRNSFKTVKDGDLSDLEAMLVGQAMALQSLFTSLARRADTLVHQLTVGECRATTGCRMQMNMVRTIVLRGIVITSKLAGNRGWCPLERAGNCPYTNTSLSHACNRNAVPRLELLVRCLFLHLHTLQDRVLHFICEST
jgi:hypothetical protein